MPFSSWLRAWKRFLLAPSRPARQAYRPRASLRPRLEALEDRTMPANFTAATTADLVAAIHSANSAGGSNTITLAPGATFNLTAVDNTTDGANGLPVIAAGDNLTLVGNGDIIQRSSAAGTPAFRLLDVAAGASLTLENLTLEFGQAQGTGSAADGGAIYNQGSVTLDGATVKNNIAQGSNGAFGQPGADAAGGAIWSNGTLMLEDATVVQANLALGGQGGAAFGKQVAANGGGGYGGGVYEAGGTVAVTNASLTGNTARGGVGGQAQYVQFQYPGNGGAGSGGAIYVAAGNLSLNGANVSSDHAQGGTGGYSPLGSYLKGGVGGAASGGAIAVAGGTVTAVSSQFQSDTAQGGTGGKGGGDWGGGLGGNAYGGALFVGAGSVKFTNDTETTNQAQGGQPGPGYYGWGLFRPGKPFGAGIYDAAPGTLEVDGGTVYDIYNLGTWTVNDAIAFRVTNLGKLTVRNSLILGSLGTFTDGGGNTYAAAPPTIGSLTASPNPMTAGTNTVTLTASNVSDPNRGGSIAFLQFYVQYGGATYFMGDGTQVSPGIWSFTATNNYAPGTYTFLAVAQDNYGASSAQVATTDQVI